MHGGALITVKVEHGRGVRCAFAFQIEGVGRCRCDQRHKRVHAFEGVVEQQATFGDDVMSAPRFAAQQFYEIVALAVDLLISIDSVIRNQHQRCLIGERAPLNRSPHLPDDSVHAFEHEEMRLRVVVVVCDVIEVLDH